MGLLSAAAHAAAVLILAVNPAGFAAWALGTSSLHMRHLHPPVGAGILLLGALQALVMGAFLGGLFALIWNSMDN